jgi:hypothetical protein
MSSLNAENVLNLIDQLPPVEQARLRQLLAERPRVLPQPADRGAPNGAALKPPLDKRLPNRPAHDSSRELRWLAEHRHEYANQWVALEGDRLIAASPNRDEVSVAAAVDGAHLPLFAFIEDPDRLYAGF